ncbi:ATP-binding protein [Clostridium sp. A1-XYC3]|uniref:histidine kinase n=1 Tax=Clostridium tanneri TaxID=3037988 RepID=A0ABU4JVU5_9CLOT|nr:ATP-binding protein [Clostridium sp. A1-XYC3]MDW8802049.1 ATP-binding protein [Clostridium sp. A1-XYC3]
MKRNLFSKLFLTYLLLILLAIGIVSSLFYVFFNNYYYGIREQQLLTQGKEISKVVSTNIKNKDFAQIDETIKVYNKINVSRMWIVNKEGNIISGPSKIDNPDNECPESEEIRRALNGEIVINRGNIRYSADPVLSVALPIYVEGNIGGAVFVCNPLSDINNSISQALKIVILAGVIAVIVLASVSFFISRNITKPIKEITEISLEMAKGNFTQRVKFTSNDEIGKLAETFNYMTVKLDKTLRDLEQEKDKMIEMERMQREFVANASHELRTPLTSVRGYIEAILDGVINKKEQEKKYLRIVLKETLRLHKLVNSLLDLSRMEAGHVKINKRQLSINEVIEKAVNRLKPLAEENDLSLELEKSADLPKVIGDEDLIEQVIINYVTNAVRFTPKSGRILVKSDISDGKVNVHVIDTGIGISPEELPNVWKRFYKINDARPLSKEGSGLGLSLVKELMELLGGRAWAESFPGKGSIFSFSLPVKERQ